MRRIIRHIVTLVTFERWSISWDKASTGADEIQTSRSERFLVEEVKHDKEKGQSRGKPFEKRADE